MSSTSMKIHMQISMVLEFVFDRLVDLLNIIYIMYKLKVWILNNNVQFLKYDGQGNLNTYHLLYSVIWYNLDQHIITRTSERVITLQRSCELFLCKDISRICRISEISLPKNNELKCTGETAISIGRCSNTLQVHSNVITHCDVTMMSLVMLLSIVMLQCSSLTTLLTHCDVIISHGT